MSTLEIILQTMDPVPAPAANGPQGPQGPQGFQGAQGSQGTQGSAGLQGGMLCYQSSCIPTTTVFAPGIGVQSVRSDTWPATGVLVSTATVDGYVVQELYLTDSTVVRRVFTPAATATDMLHDTMNPVTVSATSNYVPVSAAAAVDGNINTYWDYAYRCQLTVALETPRPITDYSIRTLGPGIGYPTAWTLTGSGGLIDTKSAQAFNLSTRVFTPTPSDTLHSWYCLEVSTSYLQGNIVEFNLIGPSMESLGLPYGWSTWG